MAFHEGRPVVYFRDGFNIIEGVTMVLLVCSGACKVRACGQCGAVRPDGPNASSAVHVCGTVLSPVLAAVPKTGWRQRCALLYDVC